MNSPELKKIVNLSLSYKAELGAPEDELTQYQRGVSTRQNLQLILVTQRSVVAGAFLTKGRTGDEDWRFNVKVQYLQAA